MRSRGQVQLAWPFALVGATIGGYLPGHSATVTVAAVLGMMGALVSSSLDRVGCWQVAVLSPMVGGITGVAIGWSYDGLDSGAIGFASGLGFGLMALPPLTLMAEAARRALAARPGTPVERVYRRRVWLLGAATVALIALAMPALASPWAYPTRSPLSWGAGALLLVLAAADVYGCWRLRRLVRDLPPLRRRREDSPPLDGDTVRHDLGVGDEQAEVLEPVHPYRSRPRVTFLLHGDPGRAALAMADALVLDGLLLLAVGGALLISR